MSLLQRIEVFSKTKKAKVEAGPTSLAERRGEALGAVGVRRRICNEHKQPCQPNRCKSKAAELSKSPSAPCQAPDASAGQPAAEPGPDDDQRQDAANVQGQESENQASVSGRTHLAASSFYGKSRLRLVERCVLRLLAAAQRKLQGAVDDTFQVFPLQEPAFKWADAHGDENLRIFSVERGADGKRSFIVSTYAAFWARYQGMLPQHRHYYEIIRQGWPCHLYFDLEYSTESNKEVDGSQLVDTLLDLCAAALKAGPTVHFTDPATSIMGKFGIELQNSWVVELDSSSATKFSRHVIIQIPGAAFRSSFHVGAFVKDLCEVPGGAEHPEGKTVPRQKLLVAKDTEGRQTLFVDGGVYTRNRAFRLFLSSKAGKDAVLQPTERYRGAQLSHKDTFYSSLICHVRQGCRLLHCFDDAEGAAFSWTGSRGGSRADAVTLIERCPNPQMGPSHHPDIEAFISSMCNQGGVQGQVRSWVDWPEASLLLLNMRGNRWCGNVGRAHKSNGIFYVVDLQGGIWYQKCYDQECRHYRSEIMPLPPAIMQRLQADAASAALQSTARSPVHVAQPCAQGTSDATAQGALPPHEAHVRDACREALDSENMHPQLSGGVNDHQRADMKTVGGGRQTLDDIICASGTGVFGDNLADSLFDKELLRLLERCDPPRSTM